MLNKRCPMTDGAVTAPSWAGIRRGGPAICLLMLFFILLGSPVLAARDRPRLAVVLVVDQMRPEHCTRFEDLYRAGLGRLMSEGAFFSNAFHGHAQTYTATGHASIATGCNPSRHGVVGNAWFDRESGAEVYSAEDASSPIIGDEDSDGRSPRQLKAETVGDWLKAQSENSKVFSVSLKDRAAVLMGGHHADGAYWYDEGSGRFRSSTYYADRYPDWVIDFNAAGPADSFFPGGWVKSLPESDFARLRADTCSAENDGEKTAFPYDFGELFGEPSPEYYNWLRAMPFGDALLLDFAWRLVVEENLGQDDVPDILFIGCSAADGVGHTWGPFSHEAEDYYCRLDGYLGELFARLDDRIGREHYVVALTSDHGVLPLPEMDAGARRILRRTYQEDLRRISLGIARETGLSEEVVKDPGVAIILDYTSCDSVGLERAILRSMLAEGIRQLDYVADVFTFDDLKNGRVAGRSQAERFEHGFYPPRAPDLNVLFRPRVLVSWGRHGTSHGSAYDYDTHVPLVLWGAGIRAGRYERKVRVTDMAPTLAAILGIEAPAVDGDVLGEVIAEP